MIEEKDLKRKLKEQCIRLLLKRAGGRYQLFEAGMLYQCLILLGMSEFTTHKEVEDLEDITCHYLYRIDAEKHLNKLLEN